MSQQIPDSELIVNSDGSVYHLGILPEQLPEFIFLVGDPERVPMVSAHFETIHSQIHKREFITHIGTHQGKPLAVISTGIGGDNIDIVLNELNLLRNANLKTRKWNEKRANLTLVRLGTSGAIHSGLVMDSFLASKSATGLDGLAWYYTDDNSYLDEAFISVTNWSKRKNSPYLVSGSQKLLELLPEQIYQGKTLTCSGFYRPQGRTLYGEIDQSLNAKTLESAGIDNLEMETAALYFLAKEFGFDALSLNVLLANRADGTFSQCPHESIEALIKKGFELFFPPA